MMVYHLLQSSFVCFCFDALRPSQQIFNHVMTMSQNPCNIQVQLSDTSENMCTKYWF